ncbi:MAG: helix-turn-helix domain-containing protein [Mangrovibacterium sp.]
MEKKKERNKLPETEKILQNIISIRKERGLSQENIAESMGMKQSGYSLIESGERILTVDRLYQIAIAMNIPVIKIIEPSLNVEDIAKKDAEPIEAVLQIKLRSDKRNQVLSLVLGENCLEILNK